MINFKPTGNRVVILKDPVNNVTKSGIITSVSDVVEQYVYGTVIAAGEGRYAPDGRLVPMYVKEGDRVFYNSYSCVPYVADKGTAEEISMVYVKMLSVLLLLRKK